MLYGFNLGREFKLSIAEILSVFPKSGVVYSASSVLILDNITQEEIIKKADSLGGTIKIFELALFTSEKTILDSMLLLSDGFEGKFKYSLNLFGEKNLTLEKLLKTSKRLFKDKGISARYFNKSETKNLSSAQIIGNSILKKGFDLNIVDLGDIFYFGKTIWVQDIDAYSKRDYEKSRDMNIGMLPPKLSQIMINLAGDKNNSLYDPFCGLGTVLIEGVYMGIKNIYASDFNPDMVESTRSNLDDLKGKGKTFDYKTILFDARDMAENGFILKNNIDKIVTEGFLGEIMTKKNINKDRIAIQRKNLSKLYEKFFSGLQKAKFDGTIVISFPFWDMSGKYYYFEEIYSILDKYTDIHPLFPKEFSFSETKTGSLLYKRDKQLVGREIFKLTIK